MSDLDICGDLDDPDDRRRLQSAIDDPTTPADVSVELCELFAPTEFLFLRRENKLILGARADGKLAVWAGPWN
jgi:hypothetical protein